LNYIYINHLKGNHCNINLQRFLQIYSN